MMILIFRSALLIIFLLLILLMGFVSLVENLCEIFGLKTFFEVILLTLLECFLFCLSTLPK